MASQRKIAATSTATVFASPDSARIAFTFGSTEDIGKSAFESNESKIGRFRAALATQPMLPASMDVQVRAFNVRAYFVPDPNRLGDRMLKGKRAETTVHITIQDADSNYLRESVGRVIELAAESGATAVEGDEASRQVAASQRLAMRASGFAEPESATVTTIEWLCLNDAEARQQAVKRAVADAMADAQSAVGDAKLDVSEIEVISLEDEPHRMVLRGVPPNVQAGKIAIRARVKIMCVY
jgi:uncharacterized protein YggE